MGRNKKVYARKVAFEMVYCPNVIVSVKAYTLAVPLPRSIVVSPVEMFTAVDDLFAS